jgi:hypothetical protein
MFPSMRFPLSFRSRRDLSARIQGLFWNVESAQDCDWLVPVYVIRTSDISWHGLARIRAAIISLVSGLIWFARESPALVEQQADAGTEPRPSLIVDTPHTFSTDDRRKHDLCLSSQVTVSARQFCHPFLGNCEPSSGHCLHYRRILDREDWTASYQDHINPFSQAEVIVNVSVFPVIYWLGAGPITWFLVPQRFPKSESEIWRFKWQ